MKVALLQFGATHNKAANLALALTMAKEAIDKKAEWILLPEVFSYRGDPSNKELFIKSTEKIPGPSTDAFIAVSKKHKVSFLLGSILEKASDVRAYNTSALISPFGKITAKYRKIHLFDSCIDDKIVREADRFLPGRRLATAPVGKFLAGLSICYDLRFPDLYRAYAQKGANVLTVPSCFTRKTGKAHWETLLRARAIENLSYVLAPNQIGADARGIPAYGNSMIISPWGEVIARGSDEKEEIIFGEISIDEINKARAMLPGIIK